MGTVTSLDLVILYGLILVFAPFFLLYGMTKNR